jgi:hypothetical protein
MTRDEVVAALESERKRLLAAFDALGDSADILGHLIHYAGMIANGLGAPMTPPAYVLEASGQLSPQEWNDRAVTFWRQSSADDVRAAFVRDSDLLIEYAGKLTDDQLNSDARELVPWAPEGPLVNFVGYDTFLHEWPAHAEQMERAAP